MDKPFNIKVRIYFMRPIVLILLLVFSSLMLHSQDAGQEYHKTRIYSELAIIFDQRFPVPESFITTIQREVISVNRFSTDFFVGTGLIHNRNHEISIVPGVKTGILFVYHFHNRQRLFAGAGNEFTGNISGKVKIGYSYRIAGKLFMSLSYENCFWAYTAEHMDLYEDEYGELFEHYYTTYNNWGWDFWLSTVNVGIGIGF